MLEMSALVTVPSRFESPNIVGRTSVFPAGIVGTTFGCPKLQGSLTWPVMVPDVSSWRTNAVVSVVVWPGSTMTTLDVPVPVAGVVAIV